MVNASWQTIIVWACELIRCWKLEGCVGLGVLPSICVTIELAPIENTQPRVDINQPLLEIKSTKTTLSNLLSILFGCVYSLCPSAVFCSLCKDDVQPFLYVLISTQGGDVWRTTKSDYNNYIPNFS